MRLHAPHLFSSNSARTDQERDDSADQENYKQNFRNSGSAGSDSAKAEQRGDQRNDKKNDGIVQHVESLSKNDFRQGALVSLY